MLAKQVVQDLHLSSDGSDSENPEETNKDAQGAGDSQIPVDTARIESRAELPGIPTPTNKTM